MAFVEKLNVNTGCFTFPNAVDPRSEVELLRRSLAKDDETEIKNFRKYLFGKETSWVLDGSLVDLTASILGNGVKGDKVRVFKLFAVCALRKDFCSIFSSDKRLIMNFVNKFDVLDIEEQKAIALFLCHMASHDEGRNYLLYLSAWKTLEGEDVNNATVTARAAKHSLKSLNPALRSVAIGVMANLSIKKSFQTKETETLRGYTELKTDLRTALEEFMETNAANQLSGSWRKAVQETLCNLA